MTRTKLIALARSAKRFRKAFLDFFFLLFLLVAFSGRTGKSFSCRFYQSLLQTSLTRIGGPSSTTLANDCVHVQIFRVCEYDMSCALEMVDSNGGFKREYVEFCSSTTKNIIFHYRNAYDHQT